ncbi:hypothetical protein JCM13991_15480 [Thermodesulfovibrio hydrogeniphilus]
MNADCGRAHNLTVTIYYNPCATTTIPPTCPTGGSYNSSTGKCEAQPTCSQGSLTSQGCLTGYACPVTAPDGTTPQCHQIGKFQSLF